MSNEITLASELTFNRESKSGKVVTRGALGAIMSGNSSERAALSRAAAGKLIENNTFGPVMAEVSRVYPLSSVKRKAKDTGDGIYEVNGTMQVWQGATCTPFVGKWDSVTTQVYAQAIVDKVESLIEAGKEVKGEKALAYEFALGIVHHIAVKAQAKAAALATA